MKKNPRFLFACLVFLVLTTLNSFGQPVAPTAAVTPANKTSFTEVTAQLDPGGDFYLYLGTAQWLEKLSDKVDAWRRTFASFPDAKPDDVANINKAFDLSGRLINDSGIQTISGLGLSSVQIEPGLYRNKMLLHHYPGKGDGFLWKLGGGAPHALTGLDLLPENTALAVFADLDLPLIWSVVKDETAKSGFPQANDFLQQLPDQFEKNTKVKWDAFIHSLGGEFGLVITLNESNKVPIPVPPGAMLIPEPGILISIRVTDDTIFNYIDTQLKSNKEVINGDKASLKMRTMPVPLPIQINLRPTAASTGGYLFLASSDDLVNEILAVKAGDKPGLKSTAEFKHLAKDIPDQGNQFSYMSAAFGRAIIDIQRQSMTAANQPNASAAQTAWLKSFMRTDRASYSYSVGQNTSEGSLTVGNSSQSAAALALLPAVAVPGLLAAIAIPNFVKARATSQSNACINNLRQIDAAKNQWALEKNKKAEDVPTEDDLKPYLSHGHFPRCPQGGVYTIGSVGEPPKCSLPGHVLP